MNSDDRKRINDIVRSVDSRTARSFKKALEPKGLRIRQGECVSLSKTANTCTIKLAGHSQNISGVPYSNNLPVPGYGVWVATDGEDLFIFANHHTAPSDVIKLNRDANQSIATGTDTKIDFQDPTDANGLMQNNSIDFFGSWQSGNVSRLNLPAPGTWELTAQVEWEADPDGRRICEIMNAADTVVAKSVVPANSTGVATNVATTVVRAGDVTNGTNNEYFRINVWQNGAANLAVNGASIQYSPILIAAWEGPVGDVSYATGIGTV